MSFRVFRSVLVLGLAAALATAGCGESSSSDGDESAASGASSAGLERARSELEKYSRPPTDLGISEPLPGSVADRRVYYLQCGNPSCAFAGDGVEAAAERLGIELTRVDEGTSPEEVTAAWDKVVNERPDGVIQAGFSVTSFARQLEEVNAAGIPYVEIGAPDCDEVRDPCTGENPGVTVNVLAKPDFERAARLAADYVVADSDAEAKTVLFYIPDFPINVVTHDAFTAEYERTCPGCELDAVEAQPTDIARGLPSAVSSYLQQHQDTNYVVMAFGDMAIGVPAAIRGLGLGDQVRIVSPFGGPTNYANIKDGNVEVADIGLAYGYLGWRAVDAIARAMLDAPLEPQATPLPLQVLDREAVATFDIENYWPGVEDYEQKFAELWNQSR